MTTVRTALALVLFFGVPAFASAQTIVRPVGATTSGGGISVSGSGYVRRPADAVRYTIVLALRGTGTGASVFTSAAALVVALKRNGSADAALADPPNNMINQVAVATVRGSIRKPTVENVKALVAAVTAALPADGAPIQNITYVSVLDDCDEPERIAQAAALADARSRAGGIAAAAHVVLGAPTAVIENFVPFGACPTRPDATSVPLGFNGNSSAQNAFDVTIGVTLNISFAITAPQ